MTDRDLPIPDELRLAMKATFRNDEIARRWLEQPVPVFDGATPATLILQGRAKEVIAVLTSLNHGFGG